MSLSPPHVLLCKSDLCHCGRIPKIINLKAERFILGPGFIGVVHGLLALLLVP